MELAIVGVVINTEDSTEWTTRTILLESLKFLEKAREVSTIRLEND